MLNLLPHRYCKQDTKVDQEDRPEDRHVKDSKPGTQEADGRSARRRIPELELWQAANKGPKFLVLSGRRGERRFSCFTELRILLGHSCLIARVKLGLQEGEEEVEQVDAQRVADNVPSLCNYDARHENEQQDDKPDPSVEREGGAAVEQRLVVACQECRLALEGDRFLHRG